MPIEIEQDEFAKLQAELNASRPAKQVLDKIGSKPETRQKFWKLLKEVSPETPIPELDAAKPVLDEVDALRKELEEMKKTKAEEAAESAKKAREQEAASKITSGRSALRKAGWTDEGIAKVEKKMEERGLADYEAAAALVEKEEPADEPIVPAHTDRSFDLFTPPTEDGDIKAALSLPKGARQEAALRRWTSKELAEGMKEIRAERMANRRY